jgi:5-methylcytosine-specific restriction endonuclease McrA
MERAGTPLSPSFAPSASTQAEFPLKPFSAADSVNGSEAADGSRRTSRVSCGSETWTDFAGRVWPVITSQRRLKFKYPAHAALRAHVFRRDGFKCARCDACAINVPVDYDGRHALSTNTKVSSGYPDALILDHILTLPAGGRNVVENFQALCETCNRRKQKEDKEATAAFRGRLG